ncbi:MAG: hypothetical protein GQ557_01735, partial [Mycoplasmataceae bacterium]|nr:hypothetical protein [Mycoplasmataceae bacterium]
MMENNTKSTGKQKKKFTMPKFPSAIVVIGIVLLFSTFLTWIPHEGWINLDADSINIDLATGLITTSSGAPIANIIGPVSNSTITILLDESFVSFLIKSGWVDEGFLSSIPVIQITINFEITNTFSSASGSGDIIINSWIITNDGEIQEEVIVNVPLHLHYDATLEVFQIFGVSGSLT